MHRVPTHIYMDPLDAIWLTTAQRIGFAVTRSSEVYAATDGQGTMTIGTPETLDPDDCLAQMILHELCHALIQGPDLQSAPDWGLDNETNRDEAREHACLRLQAFLTEPFDLRQPLAPTTDFRPFYDQLPKDPLTPLEDESVQLAINALKRTNQPPFAPHLHNALEATAAIFKTAKPLTTPPTIWHP